MSEPIMKRSQRRQWFLIPLIVFIGLIVMLFFRLGKPTTIIPSNALNRPVPQFELPLLVDTTRTVTTDNLPKNPYLLNVWGSWCPTCVVEHPYLLQLKERGIDIVGVNYKDELSDALSYLNKRGDPFIMSIQDYSGEFALDLGLTGAPETFIVDGQDNIRQHIVGEINASNFETRIAPCLDILHELNKQDSANTANDMQARIAEVCN